jgi:sulfatase modifying factor 1
MKTPNFTCVIAAALITSTSATVTMDWVSIGNANNAADPLTGYGAVDYAYKIGKYEVTNAQYGEFLNAKGASNSNGVYNSDMSSLGITQSGTSGSYKYTVTSVLANRPVVCVSWFDAARFANWIMNGQGNGDTETGAYTLNGATSGIITANIGAQVYIPSENEWYKAAYYNAATTVYSVYPNGANTISTTNANYDSSGSTDVGSYSGDTSSYGTFDQGGNVWEWNDGAAPSSLPVQRGGAFNGGGDNNRLAMSSRLTYPATDEYYMFGFRVASVPEPTSILLSMFAGGMMLIRRKR